MSNCIGFVQFLLNTIYISSQFNVMNTKFPKRQILDSSKLKVFVEANFELEGNGGKFSKRVENTVGNGEIARYEQFLLFQQCFQKTSNC